MKAISLHQPWATLIALGLKRYETRSWATSHRGPLAIHAAKRAMTLDEYQLLEDLNRYLEDEDRPRISERREDYPLGVVVCTARLVNCSAISRATLSEFWDIEFSVGDWTPGRFAWELADITRLEPPVPARGAQGLWGWEL